MYDTLKKLGMALLAGIILFVSAMFLKDQHIVCESDQQDIENYSEGWEDVTDSKGFVTVSGTYEKDSIIIRQVSNVLPLNLKDGSAISFFSKHQYIEAHVDGQIIYEFSPSESENVEAPENLWHFIGVKDEFAGKKINITFFETYNKIKTEIPPMLIGDKSELMKKNLVENGFSFIISLVFMGTGIAICNIWFFYRKKVEMQKNVLYVGAIMILTAIWSGIQTQVLQILIGHSYELTMFLSFVVLLNQFFILHYAILKYSVVNERIFKKVLQAYIGFVLLFIMAYVTGIVGIKEMGVISQVFAIVCVWILLILMWMAMKRAVQGEKRVILGHMAGVGLVMLILCVDFIRFHYYGNWNIISMGRWAVFIFVLVLAYEAIRESVGLMKMDEESEKMKNIAYSDALTCMGNRSAFMDMVNQIDPQEYKEYGIAMFDLNNLKVFNDIHGHSAGDYYLIISSEIIQDIFGKRGKIYRIGGDEFCAILKNLSQEEFNGFAKEMHIRLKELKGPYTKGKMSIAYGYQAYNERLDSDLSATMERADFSMYSNKKIIKQIIR